MDEFKGTSALDAGLREETATDHKLSQLGESQANLNAKGRSNKAKAA